MCHIRFQGGSCQTPWRIEYIISDEDIPKCCHTMKKRIGTPMLMK